MNKSKKIISILAAATLTLSTLAACGEKDYAGETLTAKDTSAVVAGTNGGFVVETADYVYFINGKESNTADNTYGEVVKGALMRISKAALASGDYDKAQIVVPSLFVTANYDSGIYIYDGYVYYATPTTDKTNAGEVANSSLDFKRAKLDGTEAPMGGENNYFFRLSTNSVKYRYVKEGETVYCLYEEDSKLKSYNTATGKTTVLVAGASSFFYDTTDLSSPNVYYTMSVTHNLDEQNSSTAAYNQIYCVNAASTATAKVSGNTASYTVKNGETEIVTYEFDAAFMKEKNEEAEDSEQEPVYDLNDYTTYPYVNLGKLVLDGVSKKGNVSGDNRFNADAASISSASELGYTYTIQGQMNGGLYFTREAIVKNDNAETAKLYYVKNDRGGEWNTITGNAQVQVLSSDTTNASTSAIFNISAEGVHSYMYVADSQLKKATVTDTATGATDIITLMPSVSSITLMKAEGDYLYYYATGSEGVNGRNLSRINYKGNANDYNPLLSTDTYKSVTIGLVDWSDDWYNPEFLSDGSAVMYANAQSFGSGGTAYNNIHLAALGTNADIEARNDEIEKINEYIAEGSTTAQAVMKYYFRSGKLDAYKVEEVKDKYTAAQKNEIDEFVAEFATSDSAATTGKFKFESAYIPLVGRLNEADEDAIEQNWKDSLLQADEEVDEDDSLSTGAIVGIVCGGTAVFGGVVALVVVLLLKKRKAEKQKKDDVVNAYKRKKIDTTDDKTIDVYADEETSVETAEEASEEVVEETVEEKAEEVAQEAPVEE